MAATDQDLNFLCLQTIKGCFDAFSCPIVSDRSYRRLKKRYVHPAVDILYADDMKWVRQKVIETSAEVSSKNENKKKRNESSQEDF